MIVKLYCDGVFSEEYFRESLLDNPYSQEPIFVRFPFDRFSFIDRSNLSQASSKLSTPFEIVAFKAFLQNVLKTPSFNSNPILPFSSGGVGLKPSTKSV